MIRIVVVSFLLLVSMASLGAAQDCSTSLDRAQRSYDAGDLQQVIEIITPCLPDLTHGEQARAYRLLALSHLFRDEYREADTAIGQMLFLDPKYERDASRDPYELLRAMGPYAWYPGYMLSVRLGANRTAPNVIRGYSLQTAPLTLDDRRDAYDGSFGYSMAIGLDYHLWPTLAVALEPGYRALFFSRAAKTGYKFTTTYHENINHFTFPLTARYEVSGRGNTFIPFVELGGYVEGLSSATSDITAVDDINAQNPSISAISATERRTKVGFGFVMGAGAIVRMNDFEILTGVRYNNGLTDAVNSELAPGSNISKRYVQTDLSYNFFTIDDDFALRNLEFSVAFRYPLNFRSYKSE